MYFRRVVCSCKKFNGQLLSVFGNQLNTSKCSIFDIWLSQSSCNNSRRFCSESKTEWEKPEGKPTGIYVKNSLTKQKEELLISNGKYLKWYMCGPTVYDVSHLGHACTYVRFDIIRRILVNMFDIDVVYMMGITDIDDKIIRQANLLSYNTTELTTEQELLFTKDMAAMNILPPSITTRVTDCVPHMVAYIQKILKNGYGYVGKSGSVYFDFLKYGQTGIFVPPSISSDEMNPDSEKKRPSDFAMWKASKPNEPSWPSPWGPGRPGWHIECSTMASMVFGEKLDIHSGGIDLKFPHHESEIVQSQAHYGCRQWCNYWLHSGHIQTLDHSHLKMSKSLKNYINISDFLEKYTANQFRMACLTTHYTKHINYSDKLMNESIKRLQVLSTFLQFFDAYIKGQLSCQPFNEQKLAERLEMTQTSVRSALSNDFNTARALDHLWDLMKEMAQILHRETTTKYGPRSPAVIAAATHYIEKTLQQFGLQLGSIFKKVASNNLFQELPDSSESTQYSYMLDHVMNYRSKVRNFMMSPPETDAQSQDTSQMSEKELQNQRQKQMEPLMQASDDFRRHMQGTGVEIMDHRTGSSWRFTDKKVKLEKKPEN